MARSRGREAQRAGKSRKGRGLQGPRADGVARATDGGGKSSGKEGVPGPWRRFKPKGNEELQ